MTRIYLDNNATTPVHPDVEKAVKKALKLFGNPSSLHQWGRQAKEIMEATRYNIAAYFGCSPDNIIFTSSGSEANNQIFKSAFFKCLEEKKPCHIITTAIEHPCIIQTGLFLKKLGADITYLPVSDQGVVDPAQLKSAIRPDTVLISVMTANNETGVIQPVEDCARIAAAHRIPFHTDAVQALGKMELPLLQWNIDFATFSSHKLYAPKGAGFIYSRDPETLIPLVHGGPQEKEKRAGTENTIAIAALGAAIDRIKNETSPDIRRLSDYKKEFRTILQSHIPGILFNGNPKLTLPNTLNISFPGLSGESIVMNLDLAGIGVSTGSACSTGSTEPSHVLTAMGFSEDRVTAAVRFSFGILNTPEEITQAAHQTVEVIQRLNATLKE